jgi:hypothetical protein
VIKGACRTYDGEIKKTGRNFSRRNETKRPLGRHRYRRKFKNNFFFYRNRICTGLICLRAGLNDMFL